MADSGFIGLIPHYGDDPFAEPQSPPPSPDYNPLQLTVTPAAQYQGQGGNEYTPQGYQPPLNITPPPPLEESYLDKIKQFEGFEPSGKWDYHQYSNGYGTRAAYPGEVIDRETADYRLRREINTAGNAVDSMFPGLQRGTRASLVELTHNTGTAWMDEGLGDAVRNRDWDKAKKLFLQYNHAGGQQLEGLKQRRIVGASWMDDETPPAPPEGVTSKQSPQFVQDANGNSYPAHPVDYDPWEAAAENPYGPAHNQWPSPVEDYDPFQRAAVRVRESVQPSAGRAYGPTAQAVSSSMLPQTPLDVGLMAAGGPYGRITKFLAPMAGYMLTPDEAQAGVGGTIKKGAGTLADVLLGKFKTSKPKEILDKLQSTGGYTVHLGSGEVPKEGLMVGKYANTDPRNTVMEAGTKPKDLEAIAQKNAEVYERPNMYFGSWRDPDTGKMYFEPAQRFGQKEIRKATKFGERTSQISGWNTGAGASFPIGNWEDFIKGPEFKQRMLDMAQEGRNYLSQFPTKEWWDMRGSPFERAYGTENLPQVAGFTSATAPMSDPVTNLRVMSEYMRRHIKGEPIVQPDWRAPAGNQWLAEGRQMPMEASREANLERAQAGEIVSGDKVSEENKAMLGDPNAVVLDRHWARLGEKPSAGIFTETQEGTFGDKTYPITKQVVTDAARELGRDPRDFSADVWTGIRERLRKYAELYGTKYKKGAVKGESKSYADIVDDLMASKAAFRGMSQPEFEQRLRAGDDNLLSWVLATPIGASAFHSWVRSSGGGGSAPPIGAGRT
jgi:hypothetical protein